MDFKVWGEWQHSDWNAVNLAKAPGRSNAYVYIYVRARSVVWQGCDQILRHCMSGLEDVFEQGVLHGKCDQILRPHVSQDWWHV